MTCTVLAIDDEEPNLTLIEAYLDGGGRDIKYFSSAAAAMQHLREGGHADAILLDRMMPDGDGISFMKEFKSLPGFGAVPVIMQTAAAFPSQIAEGIEAGAYYYLTKPFSREVLTAILSRALGDYAARRQSDDTAALFNTVTSHLRSVGLAFRCLAEVRDLAAFLASLYPGPDDVILGIRELMLNAVEHGNLGITYEEKSQLIREARWEEEIERRLALPENRSKSAYVQCDRTDVATVLTIEDQGPGFDWVRYLAFDRARARDPHGRGIAMARMVSFDEVTYSPPGNKVTCTRLHRRPGDG